MRNAITVISFVLFGASLLIFILALIDPISGESASQAVAGKAANPESRNPLAKLNDDSVLAQNRRLGADTEMESFPTRLKGQVDKTDDATAHNLGESSAGQSLPSPSVTAMPRLDAKSPELPPLEAMQEKRVPEHGPMKLLVLGEDSFSPGEIRLKANAQKTIDEIIPLIQERSLDKILVEGHADKSLPEGFNRVQAAKWNKIISMLRAKSVVQVLKQKGVASNRIIVRGRGDAVPVASNRTREGRAKNRRVEIKLLPAKK